MRFIHSESFVHRDLKPGNLLIDERGRCRIGDWGSSKFIVNGVTPWTGGIRGSVQYAAPELYDDPPYSEKIDVFAFGLILYELVVGRPVFDPHLWTSEQIMKKVLDDVIQRPILHVLHHQGVRSHAREAIERNDAGVAKTEQSLKLSQE
jgi:serine/threonine protein kinase